MKLVEVLFFDGCPHAEEAIKNTREAIDQARVEVDLRIVSIADDEEAARSRFVGSPTVRVDGVDVERSARERVDFGMQCRVYVVDGKRSGAPPAAWIRASLVAG
jgi:hypothetical protein